MLTWNSFQYVMLNFVLKVSCGTICRVWFYMKTAKPFTVYVNFYINTSEKVWKNTYQTFKVVIFVKE